MCHGTGKQLPAAVSLGKLCCFLPFLSVSERRALKVRRLRILPSPVQAALQSLALRGTVSEFPGRTCAPGSAQTGCF